MFRWIRSLFIDAATSHELSLKLDGDVKLLNLWLWNHIEEKSDQEKWHVKDKWQTAQETLRDKSGDCEDFAVLAYAILTEWQFKPRILCVFKKDKTGHAVCAFTWKNSYWHIGNNGLKKCRAQCFLETAGDVYDDWSYCYEADLTGKVIGKITTRMT